MFLRYILNQLKYKKWKEKQKWNNAIICSLNILHVILNSSPLILLWTACTYEQVFGRLAGWICQWCCRIFCWVGTVHFCMPSLYTLSQHPIHNNLKQASSHFSCVCSFFHYSFTVIFSHHILTFFISDLRAGSVTDSSQDRNPVVTWGGLVLGFG